MADSNLTTDTNLNNFLEDTVAKCLNFSQSDLEVQILQLLVHEMVKNVVKEAYPPDSGFIVREIIPVGSMAENTRIIEPNEFDFMIVLDKFHADDITAMVSAAGGTFCDLKSECRQENCVFAFNKSSPRIIYMMNAQSRDCGCRRAMLDKEMRCNQLGIARKKMATDGWSCSVSSFPGKLRMLDTSLTVLHGPATVITLLWETYSDTEEMKTMEISVDLVLAIELEINEFFLECLHVFHQQYYNKLKAIKKVHVTKHPLGISTLPVSFAFIEVQLIRTENETHKKCYKLLKYIFRNNIVFTSFMLKNLVLQHTVCCEGGGLGWCFLKILGDLRVKFGDERSEKPIIPHIFCTKRNVVCLLPKFETIQETDKDFWICHRNNLSEFIENLENIKDGMPTPSSFQFWIPNDSHLSQCSEPKDPSLTV